VTDFNDTYGRAEIREILDAIVEGGDKTLTWRGQFIWKNPLDLIIYQEIVHEVRPTLVVETGSHAGGSALFWLDMMRANGIDGNVWTVDTLDRNVGALDPAITAVVADSLEAATEARVLASAHDTVLVNLDSCHWYSHLKKELPLYAPLVTPGSYLIVEDGIDDFRDGRRGVHAAVTEFAQVYSAQFEVDHKRERLRLTNCPDGFLRRIGPHARR
jgi:cephalosporin hydroxylase